MPNTSRHRSSGIILPLLVGLLVSQILATVIVLRSNRHLEQKVSAVASAGFLTIPTRNMQPALPGWAAALGGGLFFTLSSGAGIVLLSIVAMFLAQRLRLINRWLPLVLLLLPAGLLGWLNAAGFNLTATLFFTLVPVSVILVFPASRTKRGHTSEKVMILAPFGALIILAGCWLTQLNSALFVNIRDFVLLSNPVGAKLNDLYYRYTLFPAEVFKPLDQKTQRTYRLLGHDDSRRRQYVEKVLQNNDFFPVSKDTAADVTVQLSGQSMTFEQEGRIILNKTPQGFLSQPHRTLRELSERADRYEAFRKFTFYSILFAFPIMLFGMVYLTLVHICRLLLSRNTAAFLAALVCLALGAVPLLAVYRANVGKLSETGLRQMLVSAKWQEHTVALRAIDASGIEISRFPHYADLLNSPHLPVRYWLARALGASRVSSTYDDLLGMLQDPHPNVVCQAFFGLGRRGDPKAIPYILSKVKTLDSWYSQRYGYNALRKLGWKQP